MFKSKQKMLTSVLPYDTANEVRTAFFDKVRELANTHGVDCYAIQMEWESLDKDGKREMWLSKDYRGDALRAVHLITWAYGEARGGIEATLNKVKQDAIRTGANREIKP